MRNQFMQQDSDSNAYIRVQGIQFPAWCPVPNTGFQERTMGMERIIAWLEKSCFPYWINS